MKTLLDGQKWTSGYICVICLCVFKNNNHVILLSRYILSIERAEEIDEYVGDLLQGTDGRKGHFIDELLHRWEKSRRQPADTSPLLLKDTASSAGK